MMDTETADRLAIRALVENWAIWRDAGDWDRFATCWHEDGTMMATWCQAPAAEFIEASKAGWARGARAMLLANHGPVVSGRTLDDAVWASEELEEAARLALMLRGLPGLRALDAAQVDDLLATFG